MSTSDIFSVQRNSVSHLCYICTSTSDPILSDCSAAICHWQENVTKYWWEGSTSSAIPPTAVSDTAGQRNKIEHITFRAALIICVPFKNAGQCKRQLCPTMLSGTVHMLRELELQATGGGNLGGGKNLTFFIYFFIFNCCFLSWFLV